MTVLDVGAGAEPTVAPGDRPEGVRYVGMDISEHELRRAGTGAYDEIVVASITEPQPELAERFDLVLSYHVLEHVRPLGEALEHMRRALKPGGRMVIQLAGGRSLSGVLNRLLPHRLAKWAMERLLSRDPESVFPAHYDHCYDAGIRERMAAWSQVDITPLYTAAGYLGFARPLQAAYIAVEELIVRTDRRNLATYYQVDARR
jgi:SAM-dependent methyltransferase